MAVISVDKLCKSIAGKKILREISFEVESGQCLALIGPNGAGKTTLMSCLLGDRRVSSGRLELLGLSVTNPKLKWQVGYLPQENRMTDHLKVSELIDFYRSIYDQALSLEEIDSLLGFSPEQKEQLARKLSGGQRRLLAFVLCLIGRPKLLFLDEPTAGMDTSTRLRFWENVENLKKQGQTILYSSHYIEEVEQMADRILVLHQGEVLRDTTPHALKHQDLEKHFTLPMAYQGLVEKLTYVSDVEIKSDHIECVTKEPDKLWQELSTAGCRLSDLEMTNRSLLNSIFENQKEADQ